ncbi:alpha/beta fold hydrolase [Qipengyuania psychrotolerans]|uniref:Alpha/beta hydrolase n=1 Tax=Qipengyuania psychrotolerans TaxID=2867238 RepID=A0ABX8ZFK8_9SPHN|nr:alpha/beta hydrolase [Qipengyuania psychrotolerans]QZD87786.1 alpha/beta hydrolase [Qipengyuania psychrotolerans]
MDWDQKRVALGNGIELDVVDTGPKDAPALIFLHGFPESHRTWRHQIAHFEDRFRCIAPDQRGYRGSSKPEGVDNYTPDKLVGDIFLLAAALGIGKFTIVGHDWGGAIAWGVALAGQETGMVTRAVIANAPHYAVFQKLLYTSPVQREASQYMRGFRDPANNALVREKGLFGILEAQINWDAPDKMEPAERAKLLEDWQHHDAAFAMLNWYRASPIDIPPLDAPYEVPEGWAPPPYPALRIPTLVIWAQDDLALPAENTDELDQHVDDLALVKVPDCGHFVPWEAPGAVNNAMDEFLGRTG